MLSTITRAAEPGVRLRCPQCLCGPHCAHLPAVCLIVCILIHMRMRRCSNLVHRPKKDEHSTNVEDPPKRGIAYPEHPVAATVALVTCFMLIVLHALRCEQGCLCR